MSSTTVWQASAGLWLLLASASLATPPAPADPASAQLDAAPAKYMQCGGLRCEIATEYCARELFPTPEPPRHSCRKLPRPECGNHAVGGNCLGDAKTGYILEIIYP